MDIRLIDDKTGEVGGIATFRGNWINITFKPSLYWEDMDKKIEPKGHMMYSFEYLGIPEIKYGSNES